MSILAATLIVGCSSDIDTGKLNDAVERLSDVRYAAAYGDSTTQGDGVEIGSRWTSLLAKQTGWTVDNFGANGQRSEQIAARWGSVVPIGTVAGGAVPSTGAVVLTLDVDPIASGLDTPTLEVELRADDGSEVRGVLSRSGNDRIFTRAAPGSVVATHSVEVHAYIPEKRRRGLLILGMGINDEPGLDAGTQNLQQIEAWYRGMTSLHRGRLIVWGMLDRGLAEAPGTPRGTYIAQLESWLASEYGTDFVPVRQYLSSARALADASLVSPGFEPTNDDLAAVAADCVPPSFRVGAGSAHLNPLGHQLQARLFYRHMSSPQEGWIR